MLHACVQKFDVTGSVEFFLGTKQRCMPDSLRRVREVQNQRMHGLQIQMHIIREHTNGAFLSVNGMICLHSRTPIQMALLAASGCK